MQKSTKICTTWGKPKGDGNAGSGIWAYASQEQKHQLGRNNNLTKTQALLHKCIQVGVQEEGEPSAECFD